MTTNSNFSSHGFRPVVRAVVMLSGAGVLVWRARGGWSWALVVVTASLPVLALAWPAAYAPVDRLLDRVQEAMVKVFSWIVLGLVFGLIFIPGRIVLALLGKGRTLRREKRDTYWERSAPVTSVESFERQF